MATAGDFYVDLVAGLAAVGVTVIPGGTRRAEQVSGTSAFVVMTEIEGTQPGSNATIELLAVEIDIVRVAGGLSGDDLQAAESSIMGTLDDIAIPSFFTALASVRNTRPEINYAQGVERIGKRLHATLTVELELEVA